MCNHLKDHYFASGRGRAKGARYVVISGVTKQAAEQEEKNKRKEDVMYTAMEQLDRVDLSCIKEKMQAIQEADLKERRQERRLKASLEASKSKDLHMLLCGRCQGEICSSEEIKICENQNHIPINRGFYDIVRIERRAKEMTIGVGISKVAKVFCNITFGDGICGHDLGGVQSYKGRMIPTLSASSLIFRSPKGSKQKCKKWMTTPFKIDEIALEDIPQHAICAPI